MITFDPFNESLLNKSINLFKYIVPTQNFQTVAYMELKVYRTNLKMGLR